MHSCLMKCLVQLVTVRLVAMYLLYSTFSPTRVASQTGRGMPVCSMDAVLACASHFVKAVGWHIDVVRIQKDQHRILCDSLDDAETCIGDLTVGCRLPKLIVGLLPAYKFVCRSPDSTDPGYNVHAQCFEGISDLNCLGMYPQVLPMAAPHILEKVDSIVNLVYYSESMDSRVYTGVCLHLSSSRDVFCNEFLLRLRCGLSAARWQGTFMRTLFDIKQQSLQEISFRSRNGSEVTIDLTDCSRLRDNSTSRACQLSNKCTAALNTFAMNARFGVFTFSDTDLKTFCRLSPAEMETCLFEVIPRCSFIDVLIYNGTLKVHEKLCFTSNKEQYLEHRDCLSDAVIRPGFHSILNCTDQLTDTYIYVSRAKSDNISVETDLCNAGARYLDCLEASLRILCNVETAAWQRKMTRFMVVEAFQLTFCTFVFGHDDIEEKSVQGQGDNLKVNQLDTVLLLATAAFAMSAH